MHAFAVAAFLAASISVPAPKAALGPAPRREVVHSADGSMSAWNFDTGLGGTMPDWVTTVRWLDEGEPRDQRFDHERGRLGWVEAIGRFETPAGPVYVIVSEDRWSTNDCALALSAWRIRPGRRELEEANGFFPSLPGVADGNSVLLWEYERIRGGVRRPIEVRIDAKASRIDVHLEGGRKFGMELVRGVLQAVDVEAEDLPALTPR